MREIVNEVLVYELQRLVTDCLDKLVNESPVATVPLVSSGGAGKRRVAWKPESILRNLFQRLLQVSIGFTSGCEARAALDTLAVDRPAYRVAFSSPSRRDQF
jgi:hypothetical protein